MGFTRALYRLPAASDVDQSDSGAEDKAGIRHVEHARSRRRVVAEVTDELLAVARGRRAAVDACGPPYIPPDEIALHNNVVDGIWIVIEDRVYDVTGFCDIHPGGPTMFEQFAGKQCTWQFWKFHRPKHLEEWAPALLVGRTWPVPPNPYKEPPRWIKTS